MKELSPDRIKSIIREEREIYELRVRVHSFALDEQKRLSSLGYSDALVEGAIMDFLGSFGTEFLKGYKNQFARWLVSNIGLDPNSYLSRTIGNLVEETPVRVIWGWIQGRGNGCRDFGSRLADAFLETLEEDLILNPLFAQLGFRNVATGSIGGTFREQFQTWLKSTEFRQKMVEMIVNTVCEFEMGSVMGIGGGWNKTGGDEDSSESPGSTAGSEDTSPGAEMMRNINQRADLQRTITGSGRDDGILTRAYKGARDVVSDLVSPE